MDTYIKRVRTESGDLQIDYNALANLPIINNNLLINSDFRNPINQRDQKSYTGGSNRVYTIDRWCLAATDSGRTLEVFNGYIKYSNPNTSYQGFFVQYFEKARANDNYTITVNVKNVTGSVWVGNLISDKTTGTAWGNSTKFRLQKGINVFTFTGEVLGLYFQASTSSNVELYWVKLEQGAASTSFVPRIYAEEVALCRRFYQVETLYNADIVCFLHKRNTGLYSGVKHFEPMRAVPTVSRSGNFYIEQYNSSGQIYATMENSISSCEMVPQWSELRFMIELPTVDPISYLAVSSESVVFRFDAEIY